MSNVLPPVSDPLRRVVSANSRLVLPRAIRLSAMALALAGVAAFGAIVYSAYQGTPTPDQVPLITADGSPVREKPAEEGGMQVANRDSTIYGQLSGGQVSGLEQMIPPPEQPVSGPEALNPAAPEALAEPRRPDGTPALTEDEIRLMHQERRAQQHGDAGEQAVEQLAAAASNVPAGVDQGMTSTVAPVIEQISPPPAPVAGAQETASAPEVASVTPPAVVPTASSPAPAAVVSAPASVSPGAQPSHTMSPALAKEMAQAAANPHADEQRVAAAATAASAHAPEKPIATLSQAQVVAQASRPHATGEAPAAVASGTISAQEEKRVAAVAPAAGGSAARVVQLGAVRTEAAAKAEWTRLQSKYRPQLGSLQSQIEQADLGARGIYWRIRGGSVSAEQGSKICETLKAAGQSCMVVAR